MPSGSQEPDQAFLRGEVEPYIDKLYLHTGLLRRHRNTAAIHLLRAFEDWSRFSMVKPALEGRPVEAYTRMRWAHEAIPWALLWVWRGCTQAQVATLDLDWDIYGEAVEILNLGFKYNHLYRCFTLYSRGFFRVETDKQERRVRFFFRSDAEQERDAASLIYSILQDDQPPSYTLVEFLIASMPVVKTILPAYIEKRAESSIRCDIPSDMLEYFKKWARLQVNDLRFDLPRTWQFAGYSLDQFRSFWMSLLTITLAHIVAHDLADDAVGTRGGAIGSLVMQTNQEELIQAGKLFSLLPEVCHSIVKTLIYQPTRNFWDPFWQPIIAVSDQTYLIAPHLVITSSPERNLITLLNRSAAGREFYNRVSLQKEEEQLNELCKLFSSPRYRTRRTVPVTRRDGSMLTDVDLMVYDYQDAILLLIHAKWLIRPDTIQEVLSKDDEVRSALTIAAVAAQRIRELGQQWLSSVFGLELTVLPQVVSVVVNRDFVPSGWVYDEKIPVVNTDFLTKFIASSQFKGLDSLYAACAGFYAWLKKRHPVHADRNEIRFGDYVFEFPTVEEAADDRQG